VSGGLFLDIALTSRCPLQCRYCPVEKKPQPELTAAQWKTVVASFARLRKIELISLEGGEPFIRPDLSAILAACLDSALAVKIVTSGVIPFHCLPDDLLQDPRFFFELSLDGPREVHNFLRDESWERAWNFLQAGLERGIQMRLRSVISRHNLPLLEDWLTGLDKALTPYRKKIGFSFDTILAPETLTKAGGEIQRVGLRFYPTKGLLPSPAEMGELFWKLKNRDFYTLDLLQTEPIRGCGAAKWGVISLDPAGFFSFCCEAPRAVGSIRKFSTEQCLDLLDTQMGDRPCKDCPCLQANVCNGCWTGLKCGMVKYWQAGGCRELHDLMFREDPPPLIPKGGKRGVLDGRQS
jgi:MoaA/NifB/PqqE/SkfB family radical SAM enzyme